MVQQTQLPAATVSAERVGMPLAEFNRLFAQEGPFELIDGQRRMLVPNVFEHGEVIRALFRTLLAYEDTYQRIKVYVEQTFALIEEGEWVNGSRVPDVMVYAADRLAHYKAQTPDWKQKPSVLVPDVCIEVVSPNDSYLDLEDKVARYLRDGVQMVWVVNPRQAVVTINVGGSNQSVRLTLNDTIDGGAFLPGFSLPVRALFVD
jgi:Uma2 family endonuclease